MPQPTTLTTCLSQRQMAQQKAFGPTSIEGGSHAAEHWITLLVSLDVLLDQICLILLLGALSRQLKNHSRVKSIEKPHVVIPHLPGEGL